VNEHLSSPPPKIARRISWLPLAFDSIMTKALAKSPDNRYESCSQLIALLTHALS
jgi:serine/threonine-protein kinase